MQTEPVRWAVYIAAAVASAGTFFLTWAQTGDWRLAVGSGLLAFVLPASGAEVARRHVTPLYDDEKAADFYADPANRGASGKVYRRSDSGVIDLRTILYILGIIALILVIIYFVNVNVDVRGA